MLIDEGLLRHDDGSWTVADELADLPVLQRSMLSWRHARGAARRGTGAALARFRRGHRFTAGRSRTLHPHHSSTHFERNLTSLVRRDLLRPDRASFPDDEGFRFRHMLIRDAAYRSLSKEMRGSCTSDSQRLMRTAGPRLGEFEQIGGYHLEQAYRSSRTSAGSTPTRATPCEGGTSRVGRPESVHEERPDGSSQPSRARCRSLPKRPREPPSAAPRSRAALIEAGKLDDADRVLADASRAAAAAATAPRHGWSSSSSFYDCGARDDGRGGGGCGLGRAGLQGSGRRRRTLWRAATTRLGALIEAQAGAACEALGASSGARPPGRSGAEHERADILGWAASSLLYGPTPVAEGIRRCELIRKDERESGRSGPGAPTPRRAVRHAGSFRARESAAGREPRSFRGSRAHAELRRVSHRGWNRRAARRGRRRRRAKPPEG